MLMTVFDTAMKHHSTNGTFWIVYVISIIIMVFAIYALYRFILKPFFKAITNWIKYWGSRG